MGVLLRPSPAALLAPPLATRGSLHGHRRHSKLVGSFRNEVLGGQGSRSLKESTVGFKGLRVMLPPVVGAQEVEHQEVMEEEERERLGGEGFVRDLERMDLCGTSRGLCDTVIGVLGGGQLGRMLCQAGSPMGVKVAVLDPLPDCPASRIAFRHQVGSFRDTEAVREFAKDCGALTVEIEHVDVETLEALAREGVDVEPKPSTIRVIQVGLMHCIFCIRSLVLACFCSGVCAPSFSCLSSFHSIPKHLVGCSSIFSPSIVTMALCAFHEDSANNLHSLPSLCG